MTEQERIIVTTEETELLELLARRFPQHIADKEQQSSEDELEQWFSVLMLDIWDADPNAFWHIWDEEKIYAIDDFLIWYPRGRKRIIEKHTIPITVEYWETQYDVDAYLADEAWTDGERINWEIGRGHDDYGFFRSEQEFIEKFAPYYFSEGYVVDFTEEWRWVPTDIGLINVFDVGSQADKDEQVRRLNNEC